MIKRESRHSTERVRDAISTRIQAAGQATVTPASDGGMTIAVAIRIKQRSGRRLVSIPGTEAEAPRPWDSRPSSLQQALARGHQWLSWLESGEAASLADIAKRVGVDNSYVSRMVNLTLLAPDIVHAILEDTLPGHITLFDLAVDPPVLWQEQRARLLRPVSTAAPAG
jgi:hypothetical protein